MAGTSNGDRLGQRHTNRPPIQSHHSSSVPSTPYQQPRDLRFHSRSPSPNRGLGNQSPRSVVSEAPAHVGGVQRSAPTVCKYESGPEFRKRRIPYVDHGNEELGPPKKEPKKTLEPDEHEKLSGDMRELYDRLLPSAESEERRAKLVAKLERILNEEWPGNDIHVYVFGSSGNLLSSSDSDVDICITTPLKKLESMHSIATVLAKNGMEKVVCRASAKVPIVKCWDPELKLAADLNVNNTLALENTRMIKTYVQLDDRVRPFAKIIKYWTKRRILNDAAYGGTISSYTWICMILNFLQRREPPILPSLQKEAGEGPSTENGQHAAFADDVEALKDRGNANKESLAELLFQFFRHYGYEFEYSKYVVSVKEGRLLSREEKGWHPSNYQEKEARNRLCVEEPFTVNRNLGNSADDYAWHGIHGEIRRAFDMLADGAQLEKCCEEFEFPPEEKQNTQTFQKPTPRPKPTLTRSASQSGRPNNHEQGSGRSGRKGGNRNQSAQRAGNRRASSGASFSNQRVPLPYHQSPSGGSMQDYFVAKGDLHDHLYRAYQALQAKQDALMSQLAHNSAQGRSGVGDIGSPPHQRLYTNGLPSPRYSEQPPQSAPLLPGYLYHYTRQYPTAPPMSQSRSREGGTSTNPSSPSLVAAVPALRRQVHRGSIPEGSSGNIRSQSQPGRSLPHPLTLQQQVHPGYDVSGAQYQGARSAQPYFQGQPGMQAFSPLSTGYTSSQSSDNAMPKEYVGYSVGWSPQLGPQYATAVTQMQMPPMQLRDPPPQRPRRVTPDLMPPVMNGRHSSRSPSPLGHLRSYSTVGDLRSAQSEMLQSPPALEPLGDPIPPVPAIPPRVQAEADRGGPLIVNGSTPTAAQKQPEKMNGVPGPWSGGYDEPGASVSDTGLSRMHSMPARTKLDTAMSPDRTQPSDKVASPSMSPSPRLKQGPKQLNLSPNGTPSTPQSANGKADHFHESTPIGAPLLSPVAELRTPSPTQSNAAFERDSPSANGVAKAAKIANAKQDERNENDPPLATQAVKQHERKGSAPNPTTAASKPPKSPTLPATPTSAATQNQNPWQQATRKGHKKSKSSSGQPKSGGGQPLPANEAERKGG